MKTKAFRKLLAVGLCSLGVASQSSAAAFKIDNQFANDRSIKPKQTLSLKYADSYASCTRVSWYLERPDGTQVTIRENAKTATMPGQALEGDYTLRMVTQGYDGRWFFNLFGCNNPDHHVRATTVNLNLYAYTQTKYPVFMIPGVTAYDELDYLPLAGGLDYFYNIKETIEQDSSQTVVTVALDPWLRTEPRGEELAYKILDHLLFLREKDEAMGVYKPLSEYRVNLVAHSHGATTSRAAIRILKQMLSNAGGEWSQWGPVASLTTIGAPHFGTPTADGANHALYEWNNGSAGNLFIKGVVWALGPAATELLNLLSLGNDLDSATEQLGGDHANYDSDGIYDVLDDFTQKGMARFNHCYPSQGLPEGARYFIDGQSGDSAHIEVEECYDYSGYWNQALNSVTDNTRSFGITHSEGPSISIPVMLAATPDDAYGENLSAPSYDNEGVNLNRVTADFSNGVYGNGLGDPISPTAPDAVRYFSFTGGGEDLHGDGHHVGRWNTSWFTGDHHLLFSLDDPVIGLFNAAHQLVGNDTTSEQHFGSWLSNYLHHVITGSVMDNRTMRFNGKVGYTKDSDAFIPVASARFGQFIGTFRPWNHLDEVNGIGGTVSTAPDAAPPPKVWQKHFNRLKVNGL
ncbi:MAG: hypothetical protein R3183_03555 [Oleiphilaceae bacterium]|nr:hypothetical protein [Oleiphilaceae bacterium]